RQRARPGRGAADGDRDLQVIRGARDAVERDRHQQRALLAGIGAPATESRQQGDATPAREPPQFALILPMLGDGSLLPPSASSKTTVTAGAPAATRAVHTHS